jgi:superfamily II DNA or RNA helicase
VLPTGGGKTRCGVELAHRVPPELHPGRAARVLWLAHRAELLEQAAGKLREAGADVAIVSPRHPPDPWAAFQVASLDTLVARGLRPPADLVVLDECHHAGADTYSEVLRSYADTLHLGLTATPQRRDGKPLGDHYDALVVGAQYSELLASGDIVPCRVRRAPEYLGSDLARSPLAEWRDVAGGRLTFAFAPTVERAHEWAADFARAGIPSAALDGDTPDDRRAELLELFRSGSLRVLWNVYVLTEGVDVPAAECCLLARGSGHAGTYLQMVGRVLRPALGKVDSLLLDMSGASWLHGLPTADRQYALTGRSIAVTGEALKNCPQCGSCIPAAQPECPDCGYVWQRQERRKPKIWDMALQWAADEAGGIEHVGVQHKRREWDRLMALVETRENFSLGFARKEFEKLFGEAPRAEWLAEVQEGVQARELARLRAVAESKGYKPGWVAYRFKALFGRWPRRVA